MQRFASGDAGSRGTRRGGPLDRLDCARGLDHASSERVDLARRGRRRCIGPVGQPAERDDESRRASTAPATLSRSGRRSSQTAAVGPAAQGYL